MIEQIGRKSVLLAVVTSLHLLLVVEHSTHTSTKAPWLLQRPERYPRGLLYRCCWATATAAVLLLYSCCRCRSDVSRDCALLCNSEEAWSDIVLPPQLHRLLRLPVCVRFDFLARQE